MGWDVMGMGWKSLFGTTLRSSLCNANNSTLKTPTPKMYHIFGKLKISGTDEPTNGQAFLGVGLYHPLLISCPANKAEKVEVVIYRAIRSGG